MAPTADPDFVWRMEDVLSVDQRPVDPARPAVCLTRRASACWARSVPRFHRLPARRRGPEYVRGGEVNLFLVTEPPRFWRAVFVSDWRTQLDFARCVKTLFDVHYPDTEWIVVVTDQLNTHSPASLYAAYPAAGAKRRTERLEIHHTPKHGSLLNMAELELNVLARQCLRQRISNRVTMEHAMTAWKERRNQRIARINWQFTSTDAPTKLRRLDPAFEF